MIYPKVLTVAAAMTCAFATFPAAADPDKDESGKRLSYGYYGRDDGHYADSEKRFEGKEEYWDGSCKIERKWEGNGEYKEERKCHAAPHEQPAPAVVISLPPIVIGPAPR